MKINFSRQRTTAKTALVLFANDSKKLLVPSKGIDPKVITQVAKAIQLSNFEGKREQTLDIIAPSTTNERIIVVGTGDEATLAAREVEILGGVIAGAAASSKVSAMSVVAYLPTKEPHDTAALLASGAALRAYKFDVYKTKKSKTKKPEPTLTFHCANPEKSNRAFQHLDAVRQGNHIARDLVNEPANILHPVEFARRTKDLARVGVKVEILNAAQMKRLGMHALLGVAQGSEHEARLVIMRWNGGKKGETPVAFVGKGVTFDTGGVSIKPAAGMEEMKGDMAGAACVTGLMLALAKRRAKVNAIGAIGIVENAVDGKAQRPGDIVKSMSGQTIAVLNTDAEGRLVLADVLWYVQQRFKPKFMVNLATLTGAIIVALGKEYAGLFSNNDELATRLHEAGNATGERCWRMPLAPEYDKLIDHDVADMKNIGGRYGGAITGAQFIQRFVNKVPWAHIDLAGTAIDSNKSAINQSWASGWGVRLLNHLVEKHYEK
jgi:leucyl aminopeptidase